MARSDRCAIAQKGGGRPAAEAAGSFTGLSRRREDGSALALPLSRRSLPHHGVDKDRARQLVGERGRIVAAGFYDPYWRWRDCFNKLGRCFDPVTQDVYLEQAGLVWGGLAAISLAGGLALLLSWRR
jgi:hypothetical protein